MTAFTDSARQAPPLRIGWASTDITPDGPVQLQGQFHERVSKFVHDPCTATALALEGGDTGGPADSAEQAIMICCDLVSVSRQVVEQVRRRLEKRLPDFDARKLIINTTHTHTGPTLTENLYPPPGPGVIAPGECAALLVERVTEAAINAWQNRKPGGISWALGHAVLGFNRRVAYADGSSRMYGPSDSEHFAGLEGGMDPGVELLFTWDGQNRLTGVMVNVACPSQVVEGEYFVSADFWHPAREELRRRLGQDLFVYPMCGAAGDQSPRDLVRRNRGEPSMRQVEGMNELGRRLALAVEDAFHTAQSPVTTEVVFAHHVEELSLPRRKATAAEAATAREELARLTAGGAPDLSQAAGRLIPRQERVIEYFQTQGDDPRFSMDLHVLRLGEIAIATNPFELYLDFGLQIKARSKALQTFVVQLANDQGMYLPTARAVAGGSYGAMIYDNHVGPEGGQILVDRTVECINGMWPPASATGKINPA